MNKLLQGKCLLIINGSSDIAKAISLKCHECGGDIIVGVRRDSAIFGSEISKVYNILSSYETINNFAECICPQLDGVVISIGNVSLRPSANINPEWLNIQLDSHIKIMVYVVSALYRHKKLNRGASIVFISSINGPVVASVGSAVYGMLKSAVTGFSREIAKEYCVKSIRSNCICAGMVETNYIQDSFNDHQIEKMKKMNLTGKLVTLDDISNTVVFLLSDLSKSITGTNIVVDGGYSVNL